MDHYYIDNKDLKHEIKVLKYQLGEKEFLIKSDRGVFSANQIDKGTDIFIGTLLSLPLKGKILDLGAGSGVIGIVLKTINPEIEIDFSDINERAINLVKLNLEAHKLKGNIYLSDSFEKIKENYDYILLNSPISVGKEKCYQMYREAKEHLKTNGQLIIVIRKDKGALSHQKYLLSLFRDVKIINKEKGYYVIRSY